MDSKRRHATMVLGRHGVVSLAMLCQEPVVLEETHLKSARGHCLTTAYFSTQHNLWFHHHHAHDQCCARHGENVTFDSAGAGSICLKTCRLGTLPDRRACSLVGT
jgi:hypothetical protein